MLQIDAGTSVPFPSGGWVMILIFYIGELKLLAATNVAPLSVPAS